MVDAWRGAFETEPRRKCAAAAIVHSGVRTLRPQGACRTRGIWSGGRHRLAIVVLESTLALDLAIPVQVFGLAAFTTLRGRATPPYDVLLCGDVSAIPENALGFTLGGLAPVEAIATAETVVVPSLEDPLSAQCPEVLEAVAEAGETGARMISLCTGAFVLGQAGLLDGRRVATHWSWTRAFRTAFPTVELEENAGFVDDGQILSSACVPATTELCLHVLSADLGLAYAEAVGRLLIHKSDGTSSEQQARTVPVPRQPPVPRQTDGSLAPLLCWLTDHLHEPLDVERIADRAHLSARTLTRHFRTQTGTTPIEWILRQRVEAARSLLEDTDLTVLQVACSAGFGTAETMRRAFTRRLGISPRDYRIAVRGRSWFDHTPHPAPSVRQRADFTTRRRADPVPSRPDLLRIRSGRTYSPKDSQCTEHQGSTRDPDN